VRFQFESSQELGNCGIDYERIEKIHVVADEKARPLRIESRGTMDFESCPSETKNIAKK
jgi:hypothetical protein